MKRSEACSTGVPARAARGRTTPLRRIGMVGAFALGVSIVLFARGATPSVRAADPLPVLGAIGGTPVAVAVHGDVAVVGLGMAVSVVDVSGTEYREIARSAPLPGMVRQIAFDGEFAYARLQGGVGADVAVLDLRDPSAPEHVTTVDVGGTGDLALSGDRLYATREHGFAVVDVSDPRAPRLVGSFEDDRIWWRVVAGGATVYALCETGPTWLLVVVGAGDPSRLQILGEVPLTGSGRDLAIADDDLVVVLTAEVFAPKPARLNVIDVSRPTESTVLAGVDTRYNMLSEVAAQGHRVWVAGQLDDRSYRYALDGYDLTAASAPAPLGEGYPLPGEFDDLQSDADHVFFLSARALHGLDVTDPTAPAVSGATSPYADFRSPVPFDDLVFVTGGETVAFDVRDPAQPRLALHVTGLAHVALLRVLSPTRVLVAGTEGDETGSCTLKTIDVSVPDRSTVLAARTEPGDCADLAVAGSRALLAAGDRVHLVDVDSTGALTPVGQIQIEESARHVAATDRLAWVVSASASWFGGRWIEAFDVSEPAAPRQLGKLSLTASVAPVMQGPSEVLAEGTLAWVADADRLRVLEVDADDVLIEHAPIPVQSDSDYLARDGDTLFVVGYSSETWWSLKVFDVTDPRRPRPVSDLDQRAFPAFGAGAFAGRIATVPGRLYLETSHAGVVILDTRGVVNPPSPSPRPTEVAITPTVTATPAATATPRPPTPHGPGSTLFLPRTDA